MKYAIYIAIINFKYDVVIEDIESSVCPAPRETKKSIENLTSDNTLPQNKSNVDFIYSSAHCSDLQRLKIEINDVGSNKQKKAKPMGELLLEEEQYVK